MALRIAELSKPASWWESGNVTLLSGQIAVELNDAGTVEYFFVGDGKPVSYGTGYTRLRAAKITDGLQAEITANKNLLQNQITGNRNSLQSQITGNRNSLQSQITGNQRGIAGL